MHTIIRQVADTQGHYYRFFEDGQVLHLFFGHIPGDKGPASSINNLDAEHAARVVHQKREIIFDITTEDFDRVLAIAKEFLRA